MLYHATPSIRPSYPPNILPTQVRYVSSTEIPTLPFQTGGTTSLTVGKQYFVSTVTTCGCHQVLNLQRLPDLAAEG